MGRKGAAFLHPLADVDRQPAARHHWEVVACMVRKRHILSQMEPRGISLPSGLFGDTHPMTGEPSNEEEAPSTGAPPSRSMVGTACPEPTATARPVQERPGANAHTDILLCQGFS